MATGPGSSKPLAGVSALFFAAMATTRHSGRRGPAGLRRSAAWLTGLAALLKMTRGEGGPGSQFGEDRILAEIFGNVVTGHCAEIGAHDGLTGSATLAFERRGWTCLLVEPNRQLIEQIRQNRSCAIDDRAASAREGTATFYVADHIEQMSTLELDPTHHRWVQNLGGQLRETVVNTARLDTILEEAGFSRLDFLTIDVEGHELHVLHGLTLERFQPRVVIIEENVLRRRSAIVKHMASKGYVNFRRTGVNDWYAREDDAELIDPIALTRFRSERQVLWLRQAAMTMLARHVPSSVKRRFYALRASLRLIRRSAAPREAGR